MVSKNISNSCYPISVKMDKEMKNGTLILNVIHGKELEIEYKKNEIIEKINSFFGYNLIENIKLKIAQEKLNKEFTTFPKIKNLKSVHEKMRKVDDHQIKSSLNNFLKAYNDRYK